MDNKELDLTNPEELSLEELLGGEFSGELTDEALFSDESIINFEQDPQEEPARQTEKAPDKRPHGRKKKKEEKLPWQKSVLLYLHDLAYLLAVVVVIFLLFFRVVVVSGTSMNNTLMDGDYLLLVGDLFYREPQRGDVIVASKDGFEDGAPIVKRVIATEGQWVDIDFTSGIVYVDNVPLEEPYVLTPTNLYEGVEFPVQVQEGCIFVMGDNRNDSKDSRNPQIGQIDRREVLGKVVFLFMPGTNGTDTYGNPKEQRDFTRIGVVS